MSELSFNMSDPNHPRFLSEARMLALAEPDPALRLELLEALIAEGDREVVHFAIAALQEQPSASAEYPKRAGAEKIAGAQTLVETFADQKLFAEAAGVIELLKGLDQQEAIQSMIHLLSKGYAGEGGQYLRLDFTPFLHTARTEGRPPRALVFGYLNGLAAYGADLLNSKTEAGRLFFDSFTLVPSATKRDYYYNSIACSYASGGHLGKAVALKELTRDPYWRSMTCVHIAKMAQDLSNKPLADALLTEAGSHIEAVSKCDGTCGRACCTPDLDTKEVEIGMALTLAKQGEQTLARELVGTLEPAFAYDQALVNAELYKASGDVSVRATVLACLVNSSIFQRTSLAGNLIEAIGSSDQHWGNTMPSLEADAESVPLICWELHGLYGEKHRLERKFEAGGFDEEGYQTMEVFSVDPATFLDDIAKRRNELRDHSLASLVKMLALTGAPSTAKSLIGLIVTPVERVRAMAGLGRILGRPA